MSEKKTKTEGRFLCVVDINKSPTARQAYYFLKGLGGCRQDIIIDMVQRTLGDDLNLDLEHMTRGELMSLYNTNVYVKPLVAQMVTPQAPQTPVYPSPVPAQTANDAYAAAKDTEVLSQTGNEEGSLSKQDVRPAPNAVATVSEEIPDAPGAAEQKDQEKPTGFSRAKASRSYDDEPIFQEEADEPEESEDVEEIDDLDDGFSEKDDVSSLLTNVINAGFADD